MNSHLQEAAEKAKVTPEKEHREMRNGKDRDREHRDRDRNEHGWSNSNEARGSRGMGT